MLAWENLYSKGINIKEIAPNSPEYQAMWDAAVAKIASAEYCFALWQMLFGNQPDAKITWMRRAAEQNFAPAVVAYEKMQNGESLEDVSTFCCAELQNSRYNDTASQSLYSKLTRGINGIILTNSSKTSELEHPKPTQSDDVSDKDENENQHEEVINIDNHSVVIKRHNFDSNQSDLRRLIDSCSKKEMSIHKIEKGKWSLSNKAKISDVNNAISDIESSFIQMKSLSQGMLKQLELVHKTFVALDSEYLSGILTAIKLAEEGIKKERENKAKIKKNQEHLEKTVEALSLFKAELDKLKHLKNIDEAWALIERQSKELGICQEYITALSKMEHIKDVDLLWNNLEKHSQALSEFKWFLQNLQNAQQQFITNAKQLITDTQNDLTKQMESFSQAQLEKLNEIDRRYIEAFEQLRNEQKQILDTISTSLNEKIDIALTEQDENLSRIEQTYKEEFQKLFDGQASQTEKIQDIDKHYSEAVEQLNKVQKVTLAAIDKSLSDKMDSAMTKQYEAIERVEQTQKEEFQKLFDGQASQTGKIHDIDKHYSDAVDNLTNEQKETLAEIEKNQIAKLEKINKSLEEEKAQLNEQVSILSTKVKYLYYVAGGTASITIIQLILNIFGVI